MDFTATSSTSPQPHVDLRLDADPGMVFTDIRISRDGRALRTRPILGGDVYEVTDFEAPLGRLMNYRADVEVSAGWDSIFAEDWSTLGGNWLVLEGTPSVSSGRLVADGVTGALVGDLAAPQPALGRILIDGYTGNPLGTAILVGPVSVSLGATSVTVQHLLSGPVSVPYAGGEVEVTWSLTSARLTTSLGAVTVERGAGEWSAAVGVWVIDPNGFAPPFEVFESDPETVSTHTLFASTHVDEPRVWLIHPTKSTLSIPIDGGEGSRFIERATRRKVSHVAKFARFDPNGRDTAVVYPLGPRSKPDWDLTVFCRTLEARNQANDLLRDSQPTLLRVPAGYGDGHFDIPDGWYQVEKVDESVVGERGRDEYRLLKLAMIPVSEPPVSIATAASWGSLLASGLTWGDLLGRSWYDVLAGVDVSGD